MECVKHVIGVDISTQTITATLIGVVERDGSPSELTISSAWAAARPLDGEAGRRSPGAWVELIRECIAELRRSARETELAQAVGVSTTFPGTFPILNDGRIDPELVSLYDNTGDAGTSDGGFEELLGRAESETANRMSPGNTAIGLAHLVKSRGLDMRNVAAVALPNTAFAYGLLRAAGREVDPGALPCDFTQAAISGLLDITTSEWAPEGVVDLLRTVAPEISASRLRSLLPRPAPSWRNVAPEGLVPAIRELLGLAELRSVSIGAGDSPLGMLALESGRDTVINVRGSTDSPMLLVDRPRPRTTPREIVFHYPLPTARTLADPPWCAVAPTMRSGRVWDWVRGLGCEADHARLEAMAAAALKRRLRAPAGSLESRPLVFDTALGGERAPDWDPRATGSITGLVSSHDSGDIALAALEGTTRRLGRCIRAMEDRYGTSAANLLLAGGPTRNALWNWVTRVLIGKKTCATTFSDASLLGAAMIGYAAAYDGLESDDSISSRLSALSRLASAHPLISPVEVGPPDAELAELEQAYRSSTDSA